MQNVYERRLIRANRALRRHHKRLYEKHNIQITLTQLYAAFKDCRKHKATTASCILFEMQLERNLVSLCDDLNNATYVIDVSVAFVVTRPKAREVFAADFRDRIIHHLVIMYTIDLFEHYFVPSTYSCRTGMGTLYALQQHAEHIREMSQNYTVDDCYILTCDIHGFFMHINKTLLHRRLLHFLGNLYNGPNKEFIMYLTELIALHRPERRCEIHGAKDLWKLIDDDKSLFMIAFWLGLAIGNLTSQIDANFYMTPFDKWISSFKSIRYDRYVDDFKVIGPKEILLRLIPLIREKLKKFLGLELHPDKISIQHYSKGSKFVGSVVKFDRIYAGNQLIHNVVDMIAEYNGKAFNRKFIEVRIEKFAQRYNSYLGYLRHCRAMLVREALWNFVDYRIKQFCKVTSYYKVVKVLPQYRTEYKQRLRIQQRLSEEENFKLMKLEPTIRGISNGRFDYPEHKRHCTRMIFYRTLRLNKTKVKYETAQTCPHSWAFWTRNRRSRLHRRRSRDNQTA